MDDKINSEFRLSLRSTGSMIKWILAVLLVIYGLSGMYSISPNEIGVLQRFGKVVDDDVRPGGHWALPWPIDKINRVPVKSAQHIVVDDFYEQGNNAELFYRWTGLNSNCLTGDNNIVTLNCVIQYTVAKPRLYLFNVDRERIDIILRSLACNTIIHCLAQLSVDEVLTYGKKQIENYIRKNLQERLDDLKCGINVTYIELKDVRPPSIVQHYFDDVINAKMDKRKAISKAESYKNERLPAANAQATRLKEDAEAYKNTVSAEAIGESQRFLAQLSEYKKDPNITRRRLYLDFISTMFPNLDKQIIVDGKPISLRIMDNQR